MENQTVKPYLSKTIIFNFLVAASAFYPPVQNFIVSNPELFSLVIAGVNALLRFITKKEISIK